MAARFPMPSMRQGPNPSQDRMKAEARRLWGEPLEDGNGVKLVTLFTSVDLQKGYRGYTMVFDGRGFRKLIHGVRGDFEPKKGEIARFLRDIYDAAEHDDRIQGFLDRNPPPIRLIRG